MKVIVVIPSEPKNLETFLKVLIENKSKIEGKFQLEFLYLANRFTFNKLISLITLIGKISLINKYFRSLKNLRFSKKFKRLYLNAELLSKNKLAVVHYSFVNNALLSYHIPKIMGAKTSIGLRGYDITFYPINHEGCYDEEFWDHVDSIQYNSNDLYKWALRWGAKSYTPNVKITAAVNNEYILEEELVDVRKEIDEVRLLFVGRLHWKKGLETIFRLLNKLNKSSVGYQLDIVGNGPEIEKIKFLITLLNIEQCVKLHGRISQPEIISYMDKADILLAPSLQEGCSNVVLEAQARGLFCIVSESEGMEEVVENGVTGVICERFDDDALFDAVKEYTGREYIDRLKLAKYTNRRIFTNFSREKQIREWRNYFDKLCLSL